MNSSEEPSFRQWRSKRERDPSETRMRKRLITQEKMNEKLNEKENQKQIINKCDELGNEINIMNNLNDKNFKMKDEFANDQTSIKSNQINQQQLTNSQDDQMELASPMNQTLKQKLVSLNKSKFVIEEDEEENEELANLDELNDSDYDFNGEDLSENDENYFANDYPDDHDYNELDFYRAYENDDEREMLAKFEKPWTNDQSDYSDDGY